jgi:uncharacterized integral membrane protein (TIGR00698 family)
VVFKEDATSVHVLAWNDERQDVNPKHRFARFVIPIGVLISLHPYITSAFALLSGIVITLTVGNPYLKLSRKIIKPLLAYSVAGLGAGVNLFVILKAGSTGIVFTVISLTATLLVGTALASLFKNDRTTSVLINVGTAICGGSAIAAVASAIRAKDDAVAVSLGVVFILNALALLIFPPLGHWLDLTQQQFGLWAALAIHDTSSVVGATLQYGPEALQVGTTVKLVRALWIVPVALLAAKFLVRSRDGKTTRAKFPWFIVGFLLLSAFFTATPQLHWLAENIEFLAKRLLVVTLFLIGSSLTIQTLRNVGLKSFLHGFTLWFLVSIGSLMAILATSN